jgi:hypothetical protein
VEASPDEKKFLADFLKNVGETLAQLDAPNSEGADVTSNSTVYDLDEKQWEVLREELFKVYGKLDYSGAQKETAQDATAEAADFFCKFEAKAGDESLKPRQAELLLDQCADLLERGLSHRAEYFELWAKYFNVKMEINEFYHLDEIHRREEKAGYYTHEFDEADNLWLSEMKNARGQSSLSSLSDALREHFYSDKNRDVQAAYSQVLALLAHLPAFTGLQENLVPMTYNFPNGVLTNTPEWSFNHTKNAAANIAYFNSSFQDAMLALQHLGLTAGALAAKQKAESYSVRRKWEAKNRKFRAERTKVARMLIKHKDQQLQTDTGPLNYCWRRDQERKRVDRDFRDALARITVIADGLREIYGYSDQLPEGLSLALDKKDVPLGLYDECLSWVRDAISYMVKFNQTEQRYAVPISIRTKIGDDEFLRYRALRPTSWPIKLEHADFFDGQYYMRLRGISVYVVSKDSATTSRGTWRVMIKVPEEGKYEHVVGEQIRSGQLDQKDIPKILLGRVSHREDVRLPDVAAGAAVHNVSPYGSWSVEVMPLSSSGSSVESLDDVILEFHLASSVFGKAGRI